MAAKVPSFEFFENILLQNNFGPNIYAEPFMPLKICLSLFLTTDGLLDAVIHTNVLHDEHREPVRNALLLRHVHQHEREFQRGVNSGEKKHFPLIRSLADMGKKQSSTDMANETTPGNNPLAQIPSSHLLTTNDSRTSLKGSTNTTQATFELGGSMARMTPNDSKPKVSDFLFFLFFFFNSVSRAKDTRLNVLFIN
jgi:hypothetical protein